MDITIRRMVDYTLSEHDALAINRRRTSGPDIAERISQGNWPIGAQAHIGNAVKAGDVLPMMVVKVWDGTMVNGQVFLDGNDCFWATSVSEGTAPGTWAWPPRV